MYLLNSRTEYEHFSADTEILEWELLSSNMFLELVVMCSLKPLSSYLIAGCEFYWLCGLYCNYLHLDKND